METCGFIKSTCYKKLSKTPERHTRAYCPPQACHLHLLPTLPTYCYLSPHFPIFILSTTPHWLSEHTQEPYLSIYLSGSRTRSRISCLSRSSMRQGIKGRPEIELQVNKRRLLKRWDLESWVVCHRYGRDIALIVVRSKGGKGWRGFGFDGVVGSAVLSY